MSNTIFLEIFIILLLITVNGLFAMAEIAVVSARKPRLQQWADSGNQRAQLALELANDPEDILSTVQIGITLIGIIAGVFGGATLAEDLATVLEAVGIPLRYSETIGVMLVVATITYLSLVIGELVPKNVALQNAERIATAVAPFMYRLSRIVYPFVWLLSISTQFLTQILGVNIDEEPPVTDEEITIMMQQGAAFGIFEPEEPEMVSRIFRLSDRTINSLMTPRREVVWLDRTATLEEARQAIIESNFSRFPVADGDLDHVVGYIKVKDLMKGSLSKGPFKPFDVLYPPLYVPETMMALELLDRFKQEHAHMALVFDEYGGLEGLVTSTDLLQAIVGNIDPPTSPLFVQRQDDSWLIDGTLAFIDLLELLDKRDLAPIGNGHYQTVGGFMFTMLKEVPTEGEFIDWEGYRFEVMDMDGLRVDKVLVSVLPTNESDPENPPEE